MSASSHICAVNRAVQIGGQPTPQTLTGRRASRVAGAKSRHVFNSDLPASARLSTITRTGSTLRWPMPHRERPHRPAPPIECAATPHTAAGFLSGFSSIRADANFPWRRPALSPRRSTRWRRAPGRTLRLFAERAADFIAWSSGLRALLNVLAARVEPGSQSRRDSAESLESSGGLHVHNMRSAHGKVREAINSKLSGA
jgi:hypothetical protein